MQETEYGMESASVMFGRNEEMDALEAALGRAVLGSGCVVLLPGDAGVGKTRLVEQLANAGAGRGVTTFWGRARAGTSPPPFWPWAQLVREVLRSIDADRLSQMAEAADPALSEVFPELKGHAGAPTPQAEYERNPERARFRSLDSAASWIIGVSEIQPCLLILEDLHWADQATLDLLEFVAERAQKRSLMIAVTYRESEHNQDHQLPKTIQALLRLPSVERLPVAGLSPDQSRRLIGFCSNYSLADSTVQAITSQSEGNPFFIREMVNEVVESGSDEVVRLPVSIKEAVWHRLERLSNDVLGVLMVAAVYGRPVTENELTSVSPNLDQSATLEALERSIRAREVREIPGPVRHYDFAHALIPRTLLESVDLPTARAIHARIGQYLEQNSDSSSMELETQVAHHLIEAGSAVDPVAAARHAIAVGNRTIKAHAYHDSVNWFEAALDRLQETQGETLLLAEVHAGLGKALTHSTFDVSGQQRAWDHICSAFDAFMSIGKNVEALDLAGYELAFRSLTGTADLLEKAVALAVGNANHGWLMSRYAIAQLDDRNDAEGMFQTLKDASEVAGSTGDLKLQAFIELRLSQGLSRSGELTEAIERGQVADEIADRLNINSITARQMGWIGLDTLLVGCPLESKRIVDKGLAVARQVNDRRWLYWGFKSQLKREIFCGDWVAAYSTLSLLNGLTDSSSEVTWFRGFMDGECGRAQFHQMLVELPFDGVPDEPFDRSVTTLAVRVLDRFTILSNDRDSVHRFSQVIRTAIDKSPERYPPAVDGHFLIQTFLDLIEQDVEACRERYNAVRRCGVRFELGTGSTDRLVGRLAVLLNEPSNAKNHFEAALDFCERAGYWPDLAYTAYDFGNFLLKEGSDDHQLKSVLEAGIAIARRLGMKPLLARLQELYSSTPQAKEFIAPDSGLSDRQIEVLKLVAEGKSNKQIADQLVISPNTVARHIANIYDELGPGNRVTLAAYAAKLGLT